jgi:hypothetical protein
MKRISLICLCLVLAGAFCLTLGCGSSKTAEEPVNAKPEKPPGLPSAPPEPPKLPLNPPGK